MNPRIEYTREQIAAWQRELEESPLRIQHMQTEIANKQSQREEKKVYLSRINAEIVPLDQDVQALQAQLRILANTAEINQLSAENKSREQKIERLVAEAANVTRETQTRDAELGRLKNIDNIRHAQTFMTEYMQKVQNQQSKISQCQAALATHIQTNADLSSEIGRLSAEIARLQRLESNDQIQHAISNSHFAHHEYGHHEYRHHDYGHHQPVVTVHHGAHHDDDHHDEHHRPGLLDLLVGGVRATSQVVHTINDSSRYNQLVRLRSELNTKQNLLHATSNDISRIEAESGRCHQEISRLGVSFSAQQTYLQSVSYLQQEDAKSHHNIEAECQQVLDTIRLLHQKGDSLESQIHTARDQNKRTHHAIAKLANRNQEVADTAAPYAQNIEEADLKSKMSAAQIKRVPLQTQQVAVEQKISEADAEIRNLDQALRQANIRQTVLKENHFLVNLRDRPEFLVAKIANDINTACQNFNKDHPAEQSIAERVCVRELKKDLQIILAHNYFPAIVNREPGAPISPQESDTNYYDTAEGQPQEGVRRDESIPSAAANSRTQYYALCGLLNTHLHFIGQFDKESLLYAKLEAALVGHLLASDEASIQYRELGCSGMSSEELVRLEKIDFDEATQAFNDATRNITGATSALKEVKKEAALLSQSIQDKQTSLNFDMTFYTAVFTAGLNAVNNLSKPELKELEEEFQRIIDYDKKDTSAPGKRAFGATSIVVGLVLIANSLAAKFNFLDYDLSGTSKTAGYIVGGGCIVGGAKLYYSGREQGTPKHAYRLDHAFKSALTFFENQRKSNALRQPLLQLSVLEPSAPPAEGSRTIARQYT
jgi:hypothetical protein